MIFILCFLMQTAQEIDLSYQQNLKYPWVCDKENTSNLVGGTLDLINYGLMNIDTGSSTIHSKISRYIISFYSTVVLSTVAHEYGHISAFSTVGYADYEMQIGDDSFERENPFGLLLGSMTLNNIAVRMSTDDYNKYYTDLTEDHIILMEAGGLNQQQILSSRYSDRYIDGKLSYLDAVPLIWNNLSTLTYAGPDGSSDLSDYSKLTDDSIREIKLLSLLRLLSGSSIGVFYNFYTGKDVVDRIYFGHNVKVFLPEIENFLTTDGPSVKISIPTNINGHKIAVSFERAESSEVGLDISMQLKPFILDMEGYVNDGEWAAFNLKFKPTKWLTLGIGYQFGRGHTYHREMYGADPFTKNESSPLISVGLTW